MSQYSSGSNHGEDVPHFSQSWKSSGVVPPEHPFRTLVLCFDGTGDQFDEDNSNVVQFFSMLKKNERDTQMVYYQTGFGTFTLPYIMTPIASSISKTLDMAVAWNLGNHVMGGYEFLMQNYRAGDRICIFGFSRGAYTARSLAGMLHEVGLLPPCNHRQVPLAWHLYSKDDPVHNERAKNFKKAFSIAVDIEFVGVWDTVCSVGLIPRHLPFTSSNTIINTFRHAVSLDEHRVKFAPNLWHRHRPHDHEERSTDASRRGFFTHKDQERFTPRQAKYAKCRDKETDKKEVWFAGVHCDVGGGSVRNKTRYSLARIPLRWMIRECFKTNSGIMFSIDGLRELGIDPASLYDPSTGAYPENSQGELKPRPASLHIMAEHRIRPDDQNPQSFWGQQKEPVAIGSEEEEELHDALSPDYDQLRFKGTWQYFSRFKWLWWTLEILPLYSDAKKLAVNLGKPRKFPKENLDEANMEVHRSVKMRMAAEPSDDQGPRKTRYAPRMLLDWNKVTWVD